MTFEPSEQQRRILDFVAAAHVGALTTIKRDGRPQLSNVSYVYEPEHQRVRVSVTSDRAKTRNLARDSRAGLYVTSRDFWTWAVVEGTAELSPIAQDPDDDTVAELIEVYRLISGEHPNWQEYREAMVADRRQVVRLTVEHAYGQVR